VTTFAAGDKLTALQVNDMQTKWARRTSDASPVNNSTTLVADDTLLFVVTANYTYRIRGRILFLSNSTPDLKIGWSYPTSTTMSWSLLGYSGGTYATYSGDQTYTPEIDGAGVADEVLIDGEVFVSSTAGTVNLKFAQNTANASNSYLMANSYLELLRQS